MPNPVNGFIPAMLTAAQATRARWQTMPSGSKLDVGREMMHLTFGFVLETMLSGSADVNVLQVERSTSDFLESTSSANGHSRHAATGRPFAVPT